MQVRRLLTLVMMTVLAFVSSSSVAAALCRHQDAQQHAAALHGDDQQEAAEAQLEDAAGAFSMKKGALADAGAFALPAFILPPSSLGLEQSSEGQAIALGRNAPKVTGREPAPLLEPPAA